MSDNQPIRHQRFSERHDYAPSVAGVKLVREVAPIELRNFVINELEFFGSDMAHELVCRTLRQVRDPSIEIYGLRSDLHERLWEDVIKRVRNCAWYRAYDLLEVIYAEKGSWLRVNDLNELFIELGLGWKFENGQVVFRGDENFDALVDSARTTMTESGFTTALRELQEATRDLSRRPQPDLTGAIHHAVGALECVARQVTGDSKSTLGEILKNNPDVIPKPLNVAVEKIWGFASETGRHIREGQGPELKETELVVSVAAAVSAYLTRCYAPQ